MVLAFHFLCGGKKLRQEEDNPVLGHFGEFLNEMPELSPNCHVKVAVVIMTSAIDDLVIRSTIAKPSARTTHCAQKEERAAWREEDGEGRSKIMQSTKHASNAHKPGRPG
jgi:hypothetical protein